MSARKPPTVIPRCSGLDSEPKAVALRLAAILTALGGLTDLHARGTLPAELRLFRIALIERLESEGWRVRAKRASGWTVLPPKDPEATDWRRVLGPAQVRMLERLAVADEVTPGGTPDAGRLASAWHRTLDALRRMGLAECPPREYPQATLARITPLGRRALDGLK